MHVYACYLDLKRNENVCSRRILTTELLNGVSHLCAHNVGALDVGKV